MHECLLRKTYDEAQDVRGTSFLRGPKWNEDREREMRSISSLLIRGYVIITYAAAYLKFKEVTSPLGVG